MFKPGDFVKLTHDNDEKLVGTIGVITIDPPVQCVHSYNQLAYKVFWLTTKKPILEECSGEPRGGYIHSSALELFDWQKEVP